MKSEIGKENIIFENIKTKKEIERFEKFKNKIQNQTINNLTSESMD